MGSYGSLKRGFGLHENGLKHATFLGEFTTKPNYTMISLDAFPGVIIGGDTAIKGEVFEISKQDLFVLDIIEGYPDFYDRTSIDTEYGKAMIYVLPKSYLVGYEHIPEGEWVKKEL